MSTPRLVGSQPCYLGQVRCVGKSTYGIVPIVHYRLIKFCAMESFSCSLFIMCSFVAEANGWVSHEFPLMLRVCCFHVGNATLHLNVHGTPGEKLLDTKL